MNTLLNFIVVALVYVYIYLNQDSSLPKDFYMMPGFLAAIGLLMAINFFRAIIELSSGNGKEGSEYFFNVFLVPAFAFLVFVGIMLASVYR